MKAKRKERDPRVSVKTVKTPLTKSQMIVDIQRAEAAAFLECKQMQRDYGNESPLHQSARTRFCTIKHLMEALGIDVDFMLPDNQEAFTIIQERIRQEREA